MENKNGFIPALKFEWLTRFYDPLLQLAGAEEAYQKILRRTNINDHDTLLDFGCGAGTLAIMAKQDTPKAIVHGVDVDPNILEVAQSKVNKHNYDVYLTSYDGTFLPYENAMFDKVLSTLVFHHLSRNQKLTSLNEIYRILKVGGELHIVDFGKAQNMVMRGMFLLIQLLDGFSNTSDNVDGLLPEMIERAGFQNILAYEQFNTMFGTISHYKATKLT